MKKGKKYDRFPIKRREEYRALDLSGCRLSDNNNLAVTAQVPSKRVRWSLELNLLGVRLEFVISLSKALGFRYKAQEYDSVLPDHPF